MRRRPQTSRAKAVDLAQQQYRAAVTAGAFLAAAAAIAAGLSLLLQ